MDGPTSREVSPPPLRYTKGSWLEAPQDGLLHRRRGGIRSFPKADSTYGINRLGLAVSALLSKTKVSKGPEQVLKQLLLASKAHLFLGPLAHRATVAVLVVTMEDKGRC